MASNETNSVIPGERIEHSILLLRGEKVMLSIELAKLYGVEHRTLNQAVKRNLPRFPPDFMFQLTWEEVDQLQSQFVPAGNAVQAFEPKKVAFIAPREVSRAPGEVGFETARQSS